MNILQYFILLHILYVTLEYVYKNVYIFYSFFR